MAIKRPKPKVAPKPAASRPAPTARPKPGAGGKPPTSSKVSKKPSAGVRGAEGFARANEQQERQQDAYERRKERPFAFRITQDDIAKKKNAVPLLYLDREPFFVRLHTVKTGPNRFDDEVCLADTGEPCMLCQRTGKEGVWTLMLSVLDKRPYRDSQGKMVTVSKKLVPVKGKNIAKFERQYQKHGTFRGLTATHRRHGQKEASIGEDIEFDAKLVPEAALAKYKELAQPAKYDVAFQALTSDEMAAKYAGYTDDGSFGGSRGAGQRAAKEDEDEGNVQW